MIFYLGTTYWLTDASALCADIGARKVTDRAECSVAFPMIRAEDPEAIDLIFEDYMFSSAPKGCVLSTLGHIAHWNSHVTGGRGSNFRQICKSNGK